MRDKGLEQAMRQHGVITRGQLLELGLSPAAVGRRVKTGRLFPLHRGVYALGRPGVSRAGHLAAAVLATGPGSALSHGASAEWWGLAARRADPIEVTVPVAGGRRCAGVVVHSSVDLPPEQVMRHRGVPATSVERTVVDMAAGVPRREVERLIDEAYRLGLFDRGRLERVLATCAGRAGAATLRAVLDEHDAGSTVTRNDFEEAFLAILDGEGLPRPLMNEPLGPYVLDAYWPDHGLAVELDGRGSHMTPRAFEGDRDRDTWLYVEHGIVALRFTWRQVTRGRAVVAHRMRKALA